MIERILDAVNVPSSDDGERFVVDDRVRTIQSLLAGSRYVERRGGGLSFIYARGDFDCGRPYVVISCHADSIYRSYFHREHGPDELIGTFDNSICVAVLIQLMLTDELPANTIVAFTGDEEAEARGADETMEALEDLCPNTCPEMVIVLDVTAECYGSSDYTAENLFFHSDGPPSPRLRFRDTEDLIHFVQRTLGRHTPVIPDAEADESWEYDEWDKNCLSLCLPTAPSPESAHQSNGQWMHSDSGILVRMPSLARYAEALTRLCAAVLATER